LFIETTAVEKLNVMFTACFRVKMISAVYSVSRYVQSRNVAFAIATAAAYLIIH